MSYEENVELDDPLELLPYKDFHLGRIFIKGSKENTQRFISDFKATEIGMNVKKEGLATGPNLDLILETCQKEFGHEDVCMQQFEKTAARLWMIGELQPKPKPTPSVAKPTPLSASQQAWSEFRAFTESHSVAQCQARARTDAVYGSFLRTNLQREMNSTPVESGIILNEKLAPTKKAIPQDVVAFAERYRTMSSDAVRRELSPGMNPQGPTAAAEANRLFIAGCNAGLI